MTHWACAIGAILGGFISALVAFRLGVKYGYRAAVDAVCNSVEREQ